MTYGEFMDMYRNKISVYPSSNVKGGIWIKIEQEEEKGTAHLSVLDAKVLIALLNKAIASQMEE